MVVDDTTVQVIVDDTYEKIDDKHRNKNINRDQKDCFLDNNVEKSENPPIPVAK